MNKLMKNMKQKKKKGFTLVELIIVIAIIAVLAAMAIPKFGQVITDSKVSKDIAAAKNIQTAVAQLVADGTYSSTQTINDANAETSIKNRIDGDIVPKAGGTSNTAFKVVIASGNISVWADGVQLAPAGDTTSKDYKAAIAK